MKKVFVFLALAFAVAVCFAAINPSEALTASKDKDMRVWVEFQPGKKGVVESSLRGAGAQFHYAFDELNSYVVTVPTAAINGLSRNPNVVSIEEDVPRYFIAPKPMTVEEPGDPYIEEVVPYGVDAVQARDVWDTDRDDIPDAGAPDGSGIKVCIIDSGFYADHADLDGASVAGGVSQVDDNYLEDGLGHGSHVAGTISALLNDIGVVGVNPGTVDFHIVKIFDNEGAWTNASDLTAAIYECRDNGAKVINMSLGGGSSSRKEQRAFDSVYASGVLMIAAAGNDDVSDPHYPASYSSVVSVSAVDSANEKADFSNYGDQIELAAPGVAVWSTIPYIDNSTVTVDGVTYSATHIEFSGLGTISGDLVNGGLCGTTGTGWTGKIVLCERGDFSFAEKVLNVENSGGIGAIIYNNIPGIFSGTMGDDSSDMIALGISQEDGQYLVANKLGAEAILYGNIDKPASGYEPWGGTSMASPHVAGVAALVWSYDPTLTNVEIREALTESAYDIGGDGWDQYYGYGLAQALDALTLLGYTGGGPVNEAPVVTISSPADGAIFDSGATISFAGSAIDLEDDNISDFLVWSSNIDGEIGTGDSFSFELSDGNHTITAAVIDSGGKTGSATVHITINTDQEPGTMSVSNITMSYTSRGRNYTVTTVVTIVDEIGNPISGATVTLNTNGTEGNIITGADGTASYNISTRIAGTYTSTVTDVTHDDYTWDGVQSSYTLPVP